MSRTAHRKSRRTGGRAQDTTGARNRYVKLAAQAAKPGNPAAGTRPGKPTPATVAATRVAPVQVRHVHEHELTGEQRAEIGEALRRHFAHKVDGEVHYTSDMEVAYRAEYLLASAWMLFSGTDECKDVRAVFDRHGIAPHHEWWLSDGWKEFHHKWGVQCDACHGYTYAWPGEYHDANPAEVTWPTRCDHCHATLPVQHHTTVFGDGTEWYAGCSCTWEPRNGAMKLKSSANRAAAKHEAAMQAAREAAHA